METNHQAMTYEEFKLVMKAIPDMELAEKAHKELSLLCKTAGKSFRMTVPVSPDDTDMLLSEVISRFEQCAPLREEIERLKAGSSNTHALKLHDYCKELEAEIERLKADKWISVNDRLPANRQKVLCFDGWMQRENSYELYTDQNDEWFKRTFTHWQPLPEKPKQ